MKQSLYKNFTSSLTMIASLVVCFNLYATSAADAIQQSQSNQKAAKQNGEPITIGEDPGPVYTQVVRQWVEVTRFAKNSAEVAAGRLRLEMQNDPRYQKIATPAFIADLEQFFYELFISSETIKQFAQLYAQYFTLDEMQELINFYKTPLGQKLIRSNSEIMLKSQQIGMNLLKKHQREYMEVVKKYIEPVQPKAAEGAPKQP